MDTSTQNESVEDEKIRKALSHFHNAEFKAKLESSYLITTIVRSTASKIIHFNISKDGILLVGQISQDSQIRAHLPNSLFEEYHFQPLSKNENLCVSVDTKILLDCLSLSSGTSKTSGSRRESINFGANTGPRGDPIPNLSLIDAEFDDGINQENTPTYLILKKNLGSLVVM